MLRPDSAGLVVVDVQGKLATLMHDREALYRNLQILIAGSQVLRLPIFWLEQYPQGLGPTIPEVAELLGDLKPLPKVCFSGCGDDEFRRRVRTSGRCQLLLCGIEAHICVYQTTRDLLAEGYHVELVADAVSSRTAANRQIGLDRAARLGAHITSVEMALFELLRVAGGPEFKEIARLVK
ncbi:MAG: hydrolase [Gemmatimonadota bacterium]